MGAAAIGGWRNFSLLFGNEVLGLPQHSPVTEEKKHELYLEPTVKPVVLDRRSRHKT